jgi:hypothetical protein
VSINASSPRHVAAVFLFTKTKVKLSLKARLSAKTSLSGMTRNWARHRAASTPPVRAARRNAFCACSSVRKIKSPAKKVRNGSVNRSHPAMVSAGATEILAEPSMPNGGRCCQTEDPRRAGNGTICSPIHTLTARNVPMPTLKTVPVRSGLPNVRRAAMQSPPASHRHSASGNGAFAPLLSSAKRTSAQYPPSHGLGPCRAIDRIVWENTAIGCLDRYVPIRDCNPHRFSRQVVISTRSRCVTGTYST